MKIRLPICLIKQEEIVWRAFNCLFCERKAFEHCFSFMLEIKRNAFTRVIG